MFVGDWHYVRQNECVPTADAVGRLAIDSRVLGMVRV